MSKQLIESIVSGNMLEASNVVEKKLEEIRQQKMYEMKRMYAAKLDEVLGPWQPGGHPDELRARGYRRAAPELERRAAAAAAASDAEPSAESQPKKKKKKGWFKKVAGNVVSANFISQLKDIGTGNLG